MGCEVVPTWGSERTSATGPPRSRARSSSSASDPEIEVVAVSSFRETDPVGYLDQPRFLNAAVAIDTSLRPQALLDALLDVERELGRVREGPRYGPRTVDLDLLLVEGVTVDEPGLTLPHPRLHERAFALAPLAELDPSLVVPGHGSVRRPPRRD